MFLLEPDVLSEEMEEQGAQLKRSEPERPGARRRTEAERADCSASAASASPVTVGHSLSKSLFGSPTLAFAIVQTETDKREMVKNFGWASAQIDARLPFET